MVSRWRMCIFGSVVLHLGLVFSGSLFIPELAAPGEEALVEVQLIREMPDEFVRLEEDPEADAPEEADVVAAFDAEALKTTRTEEVADIAAPSAASAASVAAPAESAAFEEAAASAELEQAEENDAVAEAERESLQTGDEPSQPLYRERPVDLASELRASLFGLTERPVSVDAAASPEVHAQQPAMQERVTVAEEAMVASIATPEGRYMQLVHEELRRNWLADDLSVASRARGIQGKVVVSFRVSSSGRVSRILVERSSGHPKLDRMARKSVPSRLPVFPEELPMEELEVQMRYRYRNELVRYAGISRPPPS